MTPEIVNTSYYVVDGPCGTEYIPADLVAGDISTDRCGPVPLGLRDCCENTQCHRLDYVESGWLARLSLPGCWDATDWIAADSEADALEQLLATYGTQDGSDREPWESDAIEWLTDHYIDTLQELIDGKDARADAYLSSLIDWALDAEGDSEDVRRLCLLELLRAEGESIGPDDVEHLDDETFAACGREYLVMTDDEADHAWNESLDQSIDDCLLPDVPEELAKYFDRESWKRDARQDGRGHSLATYDRHERDARDYVVFRTN